jgi:hypothetical protein
VEKELLPLPVVSEVCVLRFLFFYVMFCRSLVVPLSCFCCHIVVCPSSIGSF